MKQKLFGFSNSSRRRNFYKPYKIELSYLDQVKRNLRLAIDNEVTDNVQEIISTNKFIVNRSTTSLIENKNSCSFKPDNMRVTQKISNDYKAILANFSNTISTNHPPDNNDKNSNSKTGSKISVESSNSIKKTKIKKTTKTIEWSTFYLDKDKKDNALHYACRHGKTCVIDILLDSGYFNVNEVNNSEEKDTPLCIACDLGWIDTAKVLVARGANVNYENSKAKTPLILSTELEYPYDIQTCQLLLSSGALVNYKTKNENTALLSASKFGNIELINLLIKANSNINAQFSDGATALMRACYYNFPDLVEYLLDNHANVEAKNLRNECALYIASFKGNLRIVRILVEKYKAVVDCEDLDGDTPLAVACYENRPEVIFFLLSNGAKANKKGVRGDTPLHIAASNCSNKVVMELIKYGANPCALNNENETPLHIVIKNNRLEILNTLLLATKNLDDFSFENKTLFKYLMENLTVDKLNMAICLVKAGCDINKSFQNQNEYQISSPLEYIFKIPKSKFKFFQQFFDTSQNDTISPTAIDPAIRLINIMLQAGYKIKSNDYKLFKESWLYNHLELNDPIAKNKLENLFSLNTNQPNLLINLCRIRIRSLMNKPINKSIQELNIPKDLKSFLYFE